MCADLASAVTPAQAQPPEASFVASRERLCCHGGLGRRAVSSPSRAELASYCPPQGPGSSPGQSFPQLGRWPLLRSLNGQAGMLLSAQPQEDGSVLCVSSRELGLPASLVSTPHAVLGVPVPPVSSG